MNKDFSRNNLGKGIEKLWKAKVISGYGATEISPGFECTYQSGHHILSEMAYVEIVDPKTLKVLGPNQEGLVVITHFGREGLPLVRYAPGDISFMVQERCACARTTPRLGPVLGRVDQMLKIKGVNIYPSQLENYLLNVPSIKDFRIELFTDEKFCDSMKIHIKFKPGLASKEYINKLDYLRNRLKEVFNVRMELEEMKECSKEESRLKEKRIIDRRIKDKEDERRSCK